MAAGVVVLAALLAQNGRRLVLPQRTLLVRLDPARWRCVVSAPVLRITCTDLVSGESETTEIPAGEYVLLTTEPCHIASTQAYPAKGTHVITIAGRTAS